MNKSISTLKRTLCCVVALMFSMTVCSQEGNVWKSLYRSIEKSIREPVFKKKKFVITDFGASVQSGAAENQKAINKAISTCSEQGGGMVVIPAGRWNTGAIRLQSHVNLHCEKGATVLFSTDTDLYPLVYTHWEGLDLLNYSPLIYAYDCKDVAITGEGVFDGQAANENWWQMCGAAKYGWTESTPESQKYGSRNDLLRMSDENVSVELRKFGKGKGMRPQMVNLVKCDGVLIEDVTLLRSPFWVIHPLLSKNVTIRGVKVENDGPNGDGCDPESCDGVLIENCFFNTGDDCIAIKSGRNADGRRTNTPSENIIVRKCRMANGHGGVVIGSEISGGVRNVFVHDCDMDSPNLDRVIRIKTNTCRGGITDGVYVRDVRVGQCKEAILKINLVYEPGEQSERGHYPIVRNVFLENVNSNGSKYGAFIDALPDSCNVSNIHVRNCLWKGVRTESNLLRGKMENVTFDDVVAVLN